MRRTLALAAVAVLISTTGGASAAGMLDDNAGPDQIGPVSIAMNDNAVDACWTNLKEVREYAEEKLRMQGYALGEDSRAMVDYTLLINVDGYRSTAAPTCVGSIIVMLAKGTVAGGVFGLHVLHMENVVTTSSLNGNLNDRVIEIVQKTIDGM
jgi:hypothetical protein